MQRKYNKSITFNYFTDTPPLSDVGDIISIGLDQQRHPGVYTCYSVICMECPFAVGLSYRCSAASHNWPELKPHFQRIAFPQKILRSRPHVRTN